MSKKMNVKYIVIILICFLLGVLTSIYNHTNNMKKYVENGYFSEGLSTFYENGKFGYINENGNIVIKPKYEDAWCFSEGLAWVKIDDKYGYINSSGEVIIEPKYESAKNFNNGEAKVQLDGQWLTIDTNGEVIDK